MKKQITFYFSYTEILEGKTEEHIILKAEKMAQKDIGENVFDYLDDRTIEKVE